MSFSLNPQLISEIWEDYKYPSGQTKEYSQTGYDKFDDFEFNEKSYDFNENIQGQASLGNNKPFEESNKHQYDMNNYSGNRNTFEGFQPNPMDYPSITKPNVDMYNNKPYDYRSGPFIYESRRREMECYDHMNHILRCRYCFEHLREKLGLDRQNNGYFNSNMNLFNRGKVNNLLDVALMIMGGVFILFMVDTILARRK